VLNISLGSVNIPFAEILKGLLGNELSKQSWEHILFNYRIPKSVTAIIAGSGLSLVGLLMQTLFKNPMAGPSVLGISSGAGLGVALLVMGGGFFGGLQIESFQFNISILIAATLGAFLVLLGILILSYQIKNTLSILIIGLMLGALTSSIVSILAYFSKAEELQQYLFWGFGSLGHLSKNELLFLAIIVLIGMLLVTPLLKSLNALLLGENYAQNMGVNIKRTKNHILIITGIITGIITAFVGPIAFIGLAVPHITRLIFNTSNHKILIPGVLFIGAIVLLLCDSIAQLPLSEKVIPINAVTSLFGAPLVIWLLIRKKNYRF
jgi:iron complex transport system permease protein